MDFLYDTGWMPHHHCFFGDPGVTLSMVLGNGLIALSYLAIIPSALVRFRALRPELFRVTLIGSLFLAFIVLCGAGHVIKIHNIWTPWYRLEGWWDILTGLVSVGVGVILHTATYNQLEEGAGS